MAQALLSPDTGGLTPKGAVPSVSPGGVTAEDYQPSVGEPSIYGDPDARARGVKETLFGLVTGAYPLAGKGM